MPRDKTKPRSPKTPSLLDRIGEFVRAHAQDKWAFAPFTGTDSRAWNSFVYALELYSVSRDPRAIVALRALYATAQQGSHIAAVFRLAIAGVLDWGDVDPLWARIVAADVEPPPELAAAEPDPDLHCDECGDPCDRRVEYRGDNLCEPCAAIAHELDGGAQ